MVEVVQAAVLVPVALGLGWHPTAGGVGRAVVVVVLATAGFGGIGLLLAGVLRAEVNLAAANGLWLLLLLVSGMLAPLSKLPGGLQAVAKALPAAALADALHRALGLGAVGAGMGVARARGVGGGRTGRGGGHVPVGMSADGGEAALYVAVVGGGGAAAPAHTGRAAEEVGRAVAEAGAVLVCGGLGGVMEAACRGATAAAAGSPSGSSPAHDRADGQPPRRRGRPHRAGRGPQRARGARRRRRGGGGGRVRHVVGDRAGPAGRDPGRRPRHLGAGPGRRADDAVVRADDPAPGGGTGARRWPPARLGGDAVMGTVRAGDAVRHRRAAMMARACGRRSSVGAWRRRRRAGRRARDRLVGTPPAHHDRAGHHRAPSGPRCDPPPPSPTSDAPIVDVAADAATGGYWLVASDGAVFDFDAPFLGSAGNLPLTSPVVGMAATADDGGYWLVAADGGVFAYGDARFAGSMGAVHLTRPWWAWRSTAATGGYWLVAVRRRGVRLRRPLRGLGRGAAARFARGGDGGHRRRRRVLAGRRPTAGCSPTATPASPAPWGRCT